MYLVHTNVITQARRGDPQAVAWLRKVDPQTIYLSALTLGEITRGIALRQASDPMVAARADEWLRKLRHDHHDRILPVTGEIAVEWGRLGGAGRRSEIDRLMAATAIVHDLILVTRNAVEFADTYAAVIDPWEA
ncbi:type II toxin-antitoxin system VapC family toxin [Neorhizobium sp. NCHU2750]|uniref:type II toxin-antitoxin system VapC family toxin n=1 Tax=Neorhizobium sp. NCHU2750 TaxID=1825976 RepID=UPI000E7732D2|nr:plasmid stabilization protein [Neorhizobium sp. NCHU2750]